MNRRRFVANFIGASCGAALGVDVPAPDPSVKRVLAMFKCHLDIGFVDTQAAIIRKYFSQYFPQAIQIADTLRGSGSDRYVWTTGSWLLYHYLEQAAAPDRKRMEQAIASGSIAWHALPFTWQTELLDQSFITGSLGFSQSLDRRFGRRTTGAKMTDVPGHSRGLIAPLAQSGVTFLDIGVNSASTPPDVPPIFLWKDPLWKDPGGASLLVMYHRRDYGGVVPVPHSDMAIAVFVRDDNSGPHTLAEIHKIYADLKRQFPNASINASSLTEIAQALEPFRNRFPVLTQEIGDTWIHGVASDPVKLARFRELQRLRAEWIRQGKLKAAGAIDRAFLSRFSLGAEHTWGTDTKTWLDFDHYTPDALASVLEQPKYRTVTGSWVEKRADLDQGIAALPRPLQTEARHRIESLRPAVPATAHLAPHEAAKLVETPHFELALDPSTGALVRLRSKTHQRDWASPQHPLALFSYQTLSKSDYDRFLASYITVQTDWAPKDFGKPNIEKFGAQSRTWTTRLVSCWLGEDAQAHHLIAHLEIDPAGHPASSLTAWPSALYLALRLPKSEPVLHLEFSWFGKRANRLPEALWLSFQPAAPEPANWLLSKVGQSVSPADVISGGNRHMHAVSSGLRYQDAHGTFALDTLDAPLIVFGEKSPIHFSNAQPDLSNGFHINLFNNGWGTNYIQWFGEDIRFRFDIKS
jgi:hypothetical protein